MSEVNAKPVNADRAQSRQRVVALLLAGVAGAAVMVVELGVARILTPVFGGSITVWAFVIATTMLALAAGYAFGGHRADVTGGLIVARRAAVLGALLCAAIAFIRAPLIEATIISVTAVTRLSTTGGASCNGPIRPGTSSSWMPFSAVIPPGSSTPGRRSPFTNRISTSGVLSSST